MSGSESDGFACRWSRLKRGRLSCTDAGAHTAKSPDERPEPTADDTSEQLQRDMLRQSWRADPVIAHPDQLDDYLEDFSEAAMAVPSAMLKSAYVAGMGFAAATPRVELHPPRHLPQPGRMSEAQASRQPETS